MNAFRLLLVLIWTVITAVTVVVISNHGLNLFPVFFGDIRAMDWRGQFNVDFMSYLALSAFWLMWRHKFSPAGLLLGVIGFFGGALFLSTYLLIVSYLVKGDVLALLLGKERSAEVGAVC